MSSTNAINFSLRQNKSIERHIVFDALKQGKEFIGSEPVYVGLGSIWFQDFQLAYRNLNCTTLISIEQDPDIFQRALFNRPFNNIEIVEGWTHEELPSLLNRDGLSERPWIVWLDFDAAMNWDRLEELRYLVTNLPPRSVLLSTFNANPRNYAVNSDNRRAALERIFGKYIVPANLGLSFLKNPEFMKLLAKYTLNSLVSHSMAGRNRARFIPGIRLLYKDTQNMVTVGGFLPEESDRQACEDLINDVKWCGMDDDLIFSQPLTMREIQALSSLLPAEGGLTAEAMEEVGIVLEEEQRELFERHWLRYPIYAELV
ncbi:MAG: hypothetical protein OXI32_11145 [bacterium]|nr:hypothetical protein [bacterium]